jgi:hypothetical protein
MVTAPTHRRVRDVWGTRFWGGASSEREGDNEWATRHKPMKNLVRLYSFWYGCFGALCSFAWYIAAILGHASMLPNGWVVEAVFLLHAAAAVATFHRAPIRPAWSPILSVTPGRIRLARMFLGISTLNFIVCLGTLLVAAARGNPALENRAVPLILTSFLLQNTVYIAVHWAFRPENLFSASFIQTISNPLGLLFPGSKK